MITDDATRFLQETDDAPPAEYRQMLISQFGLRAFNDILKDTNIERQEIAKKLQKVRRYLASMQKITISLGVAKRKPGESVASLIYHADQALYNAKKHGRNCVRVF